MIRTLLLAVASFLSLGFASSAQESSQTPAAIPPEMGAVPTVGQKMPVQKVGPDDLIAVAVADSPELTRSFRISGDGTLPLPLLTKRVQVSGLTGPEIEKRITEALVQEKIFVRPIVTVSVLEYRSVPVSILGAVRRPITFQAVGEVYLLDALTRADGLADNAGPDILISRPQAGLDGGSLIQRIPVRNLMDRADSTLNVRLYGGEEIRVPQAGRIYVMGNVRHSGAYPVQDNGDTTVLKILAMSEGLLPFSKKEAFIYRREAGAAQRNEIAVPLHEIVDRKAPDMALQADDILYVPDDKHRRVTMQTIDRLTGFGIATASGLLIFK